jgi:hypothetical protein
MTLVLLVAIVALLGGCGGFAGSSDSGMRGRAVLSPACPVEPCTVAEPPYEGSFAVRKDGTLVAKVTTNDLGDFEVSLEPGRYILQSVAEAESLPLLKPTEVTIREHEFTNVELAFDSGIR